MDTGPRWLPSEKNSISQPTKRAEEGESRFSESGARPLTQLTPFTGSDHRFPSPEFEAFITLHSFHSNSAISPQLRSLSSYGL